MAMMHFKFGTSHFLTKLTEFKPPKIDRSTIQN